MTRRHVAGLIVVPWAVAAALSLRPIQVTPGNWLAHGVVFPRDAGKVTIEDFQWGESGRDRRWFTGPAFYYQVAPHSFQRVDLPFGRDVALPLGALFTIGLPSFALGPDFRVIESQGGLADPLAAHLETGPALGVLRLAGHEKVQSEAWIAARLTPTGTRIAPAAFPTRLRRFMTPAQFQEQIAWARAALGCPEVAELLRAGKAHLTTSRFVKNVLMSYQNARMRIPLEPREAYRRYCGAGVPAEVLALSSGWPYFSSFRP